MVKSNSLVVVFVLVGLWPAVTNAEYDWMQWRGPSYNGHATEQGLPVKWSDDDAAWKIPLKGNGQSTPILLGEKIFLTTALEDGRERMVFCIDRNDGKILWEHIAWTGEPEPSHVMNGWASATVTTDGERVYAFFGKGGLHCYTVDGKHVWSRDLGEFLGPWGVAGCPMIVGDLVIQNCDADQDACITAFDKKTGETVWKTARDNYRGWSTPILIEFNGRKELVLNGHTGVTSYDPLTGQKLWFCASFRGRGSPTVTPSRDHSLLFAIGGTAKEMMAVKPGGSGDVSETNRAWVANRVGGRDLPSPILIGDYLLVCSKSGVLTCYDAPTGKAHWTERIDGNYSATPISYDGLALFINEAGETVVIKPGEKLDVVARNSLTANNKGELFRASITPSDGQLFIRSNQSLWCIGKRNSAQ